MTVSLSLRRARLNDLGLFNKSPKAKVIRPTVALRDDEVD